MLDSRVYRGERPMLNKLRAAIFQAVEGRSANRAKKLDAQQRSEEAETEEIASA